MKKLKSVLIILAVLTALGVLLSPTVQYLLGGAFVNIGYRFQDHLHQLESNEQVEELIHQNRLAAKVREVFPRSEHHPKIALVVCMDARLDTNEIVGDTRRLYYIIRTAGSILSLPEQDMLELAVANGINTIVLTQHTDCAAEKASKDPEKRKLLPYLTNEVLAREKRIHEFLNRPEIRERIAKGDLKVLHSTINTSTGEMSTPSIINP